MPHSYSVQPGSVTLGGNANYDSRHNKAEWLSLVLQRLIFDILAHRKCFSSNNIRSSAHEPYIDVTQGYI
jgi:hypothetical protein